MTVKDLGVIQTDEGLDMILAEVSDRVFLSPELEAFLAGKRDVKAGVGAYYSGRYTPSYLAGRRDAAAEILEDAARQKVDRLPFDDSDQGHYGEDVDVEERISLDEQRSLDDDDLSDRDRQDQNPDYNACDCDDCRKETTNG